MGFVFSTGTFSAPSPLDSPVLLSAIESPLMFPFGEEQWWAAGKLTAVRCTRKLLYTTFLAGRQCGREAMDVFSAVPGPPDFIKWQH